MHFNTDRGHELSNIYDSLQKPMLYNATNSKFQKRISRSQFSKPVTEDGGGFLQNIQFKNVSVVEQFQIIVNAFHVYIFSLTRRNYATAALAMKLRNARSKTNPTLVTVEASTV